MVRNGRNVLDIYFGITRTEGSGKPGGSSVEISDIMVRNETGYLLNTSQKLHHRSKFCA
jgi:hypothetical protein